MNCPCNRCNGDDETETFFGGSTLENEQSISEEEDTTSVYEKLEELADEMNRLALDSKLINFVNEIAEDVDRIDDEIIKLKTECLNEAREYTCMELGEISKKIF